MGQQEIEAAMARGLDAWNAHDAKRLSEDYAENCVIRDNTDAEGRGPAAVRERAQMFMDAFSDLRIEVIERSIAGTTVCEEWRATGTHDGELMGIPPTGRKTENLGSSVFEVDDRGKVLSEHTYWDTAKMMRDLGVLPEQAEARSGG